MTILIGPCMSPRCKQCSNISQRSTTPFLQLQFIKYTHSITLSTTEPIFALGIVQEKYDLAKAYDRVPRDLIFVILSLCAVESCPTPGDSTVSTFPSVSISGVPYDAVNGMSFHGVHTVQPSCYWPSSPSLSTQLPEHHIIFISRSCLTTCPKSEQLAPTSLPVSIPAWCFPYIVFLSIHDTLITRLQHHISNASVFFLSAFISFTLVASLIPLTSLSHCRFAHLYYNYP